MHTSKHLPSLLALFLLAAAAREAAAQWSMSAHVGSARFWGGSNEVEGSRSFRPYRPTFVGLGMERAGHNIGIGVRGYYASASLALEGDEGVVAIKNALEVYGIAAEVTGRIATLTGGPGLVLSIGPVVEVWKLAGESSSTRAGVAGSVGIQIALGGRFSSVIKAGAAVTASPFSTSNLDAGFRPCALWRREVSGSLRLRL